jgi:repressor LexA
MDSDEFNRGVAEVKTMLTEVRRHLDALLQDEAVIAETPVETEAAIESAANIVGAALARLDALVPETVEPPVVTSGGPTRRQGQFLAYIQEYLRHNRAGAAPAHADFQQFFNLTPPSVNSMLIRLDQRGYIRRIPGKARAIEILIPRDQIPPLEGGFKF